LLNKKKQTSIKIVLKTFGIQTQAKSIFVFPQNQFEFYAAEIAGFELVS
jgi:hypothetical protein